MDFTSLGIDMAVVGGIVALTEVVRRGIRIKSGWIVLLPAGLALLAAACLTTPWSWQGFGRLALIYVGASTYLYKVGKTAVRRGK